MAKNKQMVAQQTKREECRQHLTDSLVVLRLSSWLFLTFANFFFTIPLSCFNVKQPNDS